MLAQMKRNLRQGGDKVIYSSILHADELIENIHPVYSLENMQENIRLILELADRMGAKVEYVRTYEIKDYV
jgi:GTPase